MRVLIFRWIAVLIAVLLSACPPVLAQETAQSADTATGKNAAGVEPIRIGVYQPLSGKYAVGGKLEASGIQLAHAERSTVLGRPVDLVILDNQSNAVEAAGAVNLLVTEHKVLAVLGSYSSSLSIAGGEVAERARVPVLGPSPTNSLVTQGRHFYFRIGFTDPAQGTAAGKHAAETLKLKRCAILVDGKDSYAVGLATYFKRAYTAAGGQIIAETHYETGERNFSRAISNFIAKRIDLVYMPGYFEEGVSILKEGQSQMVPFLFLGSDGMDSPELEAEAGKGVVRFQCTTFPFAPKQAGSPSEAFANAWKKAYPGTRPAVNGALGYTAYRMLLDAISRAGKTDNEAIVQALGQTKGFASMFGTLTVDPGHNTNMPVGVADYSTGERKLICTYP